MAKWRPRSTYCNTHSLLRIEKCVSVQHSQCYRGKRWKEDGGEQRVRTVRWRLERETKQWKVRDKVQIVWLGRTPDGDVLLVPAQFFFLFLWHQYKCSRTWITHHHQHWRQCFPQGLSTQSPDIFPLWGWRHTVRFWTFCFCVFGFFSGGTLHYFLLFL